MRSGIAAAVALGLALGAVPAPSRAAGGLTFQILCKFASAGNYAQGAVTAGTLAEGPDGAFYGVTSQGGANAYGTVYRVTTAGSLSVLHHFTGGDDGSGAVGLSRGPDGNLYGATQNGGAQYGGTLFRITPGGTFSTLVSFPNGGPGPFFPLSPPVAAPDGYLYGTTHASGGLYAGAVYRLSTGGGFQEVFSFPLQQGALSAPFGAGPTASPAPGGGGVLYGTTDHGGSAAEDQGVLGHGTVFRLVGGIPDVLHSFTGGIDSGSGDEGSEPSGGVVPGSDGWLYGTTFYGGSRLDSYGFGCGTVFRMSTGGTIQTLHAFTGGDDGLHPNAPLVEGPDGAFYGTTTIGGPHQGGTIFRITPQGVLTTIFAGADDGTGCGANPGPLVLGSDGRLYGTAGPGYGPGNGSPGGMVFRIGGFPPPPALAVASPARLPAGIAGTAYQEDLAVVGGKGPFTWSIPSGSLPTGLALDPPSGRIAGTPGEEGTWTFRAEVRDSSAPPRTAAADLALDVYPAAPAGVTSWLQVDSLKMTVPGSGGAPALSLKGSLGAWFCEGLPEAVQVQVGTGWTLDYPASAWEASGKPGTFVAEAGGVKARMECWPGGSSRTRFSFSGSPAAPQGAMPLFPAVPVRIAWGDSLDETAGVLLEPKGRVARLRSALGPAVLWIDRVAAKRDPARPGNDRLSLDGRLRLGSAYDPAADDLAVGVGPWTLSLPAGTLPAPRKEVARYSGPAGASGKATLVLDGRKGTLRVRASGLDLAGLGASTRVTLSVSNHPGAAWGYGIRLAPSADGKSLKY